MNRSDLPLVRDLVLIGGGHTHALIMRSWGMSPLPGVRVTVIDPEPEAAYSGMLPGFVAGHYPRAALGIDLVRLARFCGARYVRGAVDRVDRDAKSIHLAGRPPISYDLASVDVGISSAMPDMPGFNRHAIGAKPLGPFADEWQRVREDPSRRGIVVIGGGVAGCELAMAMAHARRGTATTVTVVQQGRIGTGLGSKASACLRRALADAGVTVLEGRSAHRITEDAVHLDDGSRIEADFVTGIAGARPYDWLGTTGLTDQDGYATVDARLQTRDPAIFAAGDCAHMTHAPRPKAGVYAVRQAPILLHNLKAVLSGTGELRRYRPQKDYLKLISLGGKSALAERFGVSFRNPLLWRWKDRIDRRFMDRFATLPRPPAPDLPWPRAMGVRQALGEKPLCGGCGAKIGQQALRRALAQGGEDMPGDDAAVLLTGQARQVISTDHLRAFTEDPGLLARIAAVHALGDVWAMGARPQAATASIVLPRLSDALAERTLREIMLVAREVMESAGASIVGGHSTIGAEMTIGFTVTGLCAGPALTLAGAQPGDALILTKPIGSGVMLAAEMQYEARGRNVMRALDVMARPQGEAAGILAGAHAMTDITGFGLVGHAAAMAEASRCGIILDVAAVPLMDGALRLAERGIRSTLYPQNRDAFPELPVRDARDALMFDPQTGGGLLAAYPGNHEPLVRALRAIGFDAAAVGRITDRPGQVAFA
ncbi:selenide, water dikinase SelD [Citreimonas salinaria]|uniref:Selenophosphate synthase n=1 Tax=Citreimonas salinaria TaxID=321339 RepID=A0A1H3JFH3_9RHOB|nr:selenide, water dikinase SelD [Citreimonas salinaria]SDY38780.1 selenophosphate synthase [Citreimonas salinaria]